MLFLKRDTKGHSWNIWGHILLWCGECLYYIMLLTGFIHPCIYMVVCLFGFGTSLCNFLSLTPALKHRGWGWRFIFIYFLSLKLELKGHQHIKNTQTVQTYECDFRERYVFCFSLRKAADLEETVVLEGKHLGQLCVLNRVEGERKTCPESSDCPRTYTRTQ